MRPFSILAVVLPACSLAAQTPVVSPAHFTTASGLANNAFPYGTTATPFRYAEVHEELQGAPRIIQALAYRRYAVVANLYPAYSVTLDMWMSTCTGNAATVVGDFDANHGTDKAQVITNKVVNLPATEPGYVPGPFVLRYPLDVPFVFVGAGPLYLEVQKTAHSNSGTAFYNAASGTGNTNPLMQGVLWGTGCRVTGRTANMSIGRSSSANWPAGTGTITVTGSNGPANSAVLTLLGFDIGTAFGSLPLPFELPGSSAAPSGPCLLYTDIFIAFAVPTNTAGTSSLALPVPLAPELNGLQAYFQNLAADPAANPMGLTLSNVATVNFVAPFGAIRGSRIYLSGSLGTTGTVARNYTLVTRFE